MRMVLAALRALPMTFLIYVIEVVLALTLTVPVVTELSGDARALGAHPVLRAAALERVLSLLPALRVSGRTFGLGVLVLLLLTPLLRMAWLASLAGSLSVRAALAQGANLYLRAAAASLWIGALLCLVLVPWALFAYLVDTWVDAAGHARLHDLLLLGCAATALPAVFLVHVAHDLAHAFALRHGALASARLGLSAALSLRTLLVALTLLLLGLAVGSLPLLVASSARLFSVALLQGATFATLAVRSAWLAHALTCTERHTRSRQTGD
jgi:hypothetical protein